MLRLREMPKVSTAPHAATHPIAPHAATIAKNNLPAVSAPFKTVRAGRRGGSRAPFALLSQWRPVPCPPLRAQSCALSLTLPRPRNTHTLPSLCAQMLPGAVLAGAAWVHLRTRDARRVQLPCGLRQEDVLRHLHEQRLQG